MKKNKFQLLLILICSCFLNSLFAQNVGINSTGATPDPSAMLDIKSSNSGLLIPRVSLTSTTDITTIPTPTASLLVYNSNAGMTGGSVGYWYYDGTKWEKVLTNISVNAWSWGLTGNAGTTAGTNFIGTTDAQAFTIKVNNQKSGYIDYSSTNTSFGFQTLLTATGANNSALGYKALYSNTTGANNTATGYNSLTANTAGGNNTATGYQALAANITGIGNTASGYQALQSNFNGTYNTADGYQALQANIIGSNNTASGYLALRSNTANFNAAFGSLALTANTSGSSNAAFGANSLQLNTTGGSNTAVGYQALQSNTGGSSNTASGAAALQFNTIGSFNTAVGTNALQASTVGYNNTAIGFQALYLSTTGGSNTAVGSAAASSVTTGNNNTAIGNAAAQKITTGSNNTAIGFNTGSSTTTGNYNTSLGASALSLNSTGSNNTILGTSSATTSSTGSNNTIVGAQSGTGIGAESNLIMIGYNNGIFPSVTNAVAIGNNITLVQSNAAIFSSTLLVGLGCSNPTERLSVNGNINATGTITASVATTCSSDIRYKKDICSLTNALSNVLKLQGVNYYWRVNEFPEKGFTDAPQLGFIAQDIEKIYPQVVFTDAKGYKSVDYSRLTPILVEALKEQQQMIDEYKKEVTDIKTELLRLRSEVNVLNGAGAMSVKK